MILKKGDSDVPFFCAIMVRYCRYYRYYRSFRY